MAIYLPMQSRYFACGTDSIVSIGNSVQFSHPVVSDSLQSHEPQHEGPPCPSPALRVHPNPCPLSRWCHPTISSFVVPFSSCPHLSQHQGLSQWVSSLHQVAKVWSFSFNISPSNEHPGLISFRMDWLDLLAVQVTLKSLLQHHISKASIHQHSAEIKILCYWALYSTVKYTKA